MGEEAEEIGDVLGKKGRLENVADGVYEHRKRRTVF